MEESIRIQPTDGGIYKDSIPQNAPAAQPKSAMATTLTESEQRLAARGLSTATAQHFQLQPRKLTAGLGWQYPVHLRAKEKRWKAYDSNAKPKYKWLRKKPDNVTFYDSDGKLEQYIRDANGVLWVATGEADVWALWEAGIHNATCLLQGETDNLPDWFIPELERLKVREIRIVPDRDLAGQKFAGNITACLRETNIRLILLELPFPMDSKGDIGQLLLKVGVDGLSDELQNLPELELPQASTSNASVSQLSMPETTEGLYEHWCVDVVEQTAHRAWGFSEPDGKGFSKAIQCPFHDDDNPSAGWNYRTHSLNCFACGSHSTKEVAEKLGVQSWEDYKIEYKKKSSPRRALSSAAGYAGNTTSTRELDCTDLTRVLADEILEEHYFAQDIGGQLYHFDEGVYKPGGELFIRQQVKASLRHWKMTKHWSTYRHGQVVEYIRVDAPRLWVYPPLDVINAKNGLLNVETQELLPHSPDYLSPIQLPVSYDPTATPRYWDKFCKATFPEDAYEAGVHWQIAAWLMTPDTSYQLALMLVGDGGNGKSRLLAGLKAFLGGQHVTALSLQKLETDRFATARLLGKLANICPDLPSQHLEQSAVFKQLTGDDGEITGEFKHANSFEFRPFVRLVFSANLPPLSNDSSDGFYRRWLVLPFMRTFKGSAQVSSREIDEMLSAPGELSGVLNMALEYLPQIREHGITETPSMQQAHAEFREATDPLAIWLEEATITDPQVMVSQDVLRDAFNQTANRRGWAILNKQGFGRAIKRLRPNVKTAQRTHAGKPKTWVYLGIALRPFNT